MDTAQNGTLSFAESLCSTSKKLQDDLEMLGHRIKDHEGNLLFLKKRKNTLEESILDSQVALGKYHSSNVHTTENQGASCQSEDTIRQILCHEKSAAELIYLLKNNYDSPNFHLALMKDVLGVVAMLGSVDDDNISRLLAEYLGVKTMLAVVCRTFEGMKALETYDQRGGINKSAGLYGVGSYLGKPLDERFIVICLEKLIPYAGEFMAGDPQRRLDLLKPRLPSGECPSGFIGFAVNMITIDPENLLYVTTSGNGLRETLFYNLFSRLQVYKTRLDMMNALPCINEGAISLDGGMIRAMGVFAFGKREDVDVRFGVTSKHPTLPMNYFEIENQMKMMRWKRDKLLDDIKREQSLLDHAKFNFGIKKQEFLKFLADSSYGTQLRGGAVVPR